MRTVPQYRTEVLSILRLMTWAGLRPNEAAQLRRSDVYEKDGVRIVHVRVTLPADKQMQLKKGALRKIPIHPAIADLWDFRDGASTCSLRPAALQPGQRAGRLADAQVRCIPPRRLQNLHAASQAARCQLAYALQPPARLSRRAAFVATRQSLTTCSVCWLRMANVARTRSAAKGLNWRCSPNMLLASNRLRFVHRTVISRDTLLATVIAGIIA